MTVDVIVNRKAKRLASDAALCTSLFAAAARGGARVHESRTWQELERLAREIADRGTDGVVLAGGDGSHMAGISALSHAFGGALPPVALAPCGTVCTVARNFGIHGTARSWTARVVMAACTGTARIEHKATMRVCDDSGRQRVGFIFGAGLVARFFEVYDALPRPGLAQAARIAARAFAGSFIGSPFSRQILAPTRCTIAIDGAAHGSPEWSLVLASVLRDVGLHLLVTYRAQASLDRFHVVASGQPPRALGPQMPRVLLGRPLRGEPHVDALARSLRIRFDAPTGAYVLDGDVFSSGGVHVETGPSLPLLLP
jgi:diacylglycerol kinase family enzyme